MNSEPKLDAQGEEGNVEQLLTDTNNVRGDVRANIYDATRPAEVGPEQHSKRLENLGALLRDFAWLTGKDSVLIIGNKKEYNCDPALVQLIQEYCEQQKIPCTLLVAGEASREEIMDATRNHTFIWSAHDWEEEGSWDEFVESIGEHARMTHCDGVKVDCLDDGGAMTENKGEMESRLNRMEHVLKDVWGLHIESSVGTDLWLELKHGERRWFKDTGVLREGSWDNFPGGEIFTAPHESNVNGTLVLTGLDSEADPAQGVDQPVRLTINRGRVVRIDGGESADKLRTYWEEAGVLHEEGEGKPWRQVLQVAEVAFGANSKARARWVDPSQPAAHPGTPTVEAEKRLHTMHVAIGDMKFGEEGTEGEIECDSHLDFVLPGEGLTVTAFKTRDDWEKRKNGEFLVDRGDWKQW